MALTADNLRALGYIVQNGFVDGWRAPEDRGFEYHGFCFPSVHWGGVWAVLMREGGGGEYRSNIKDKPWDAASCPGRIEWVDDCDDVDGCGGECVSLDGVDRGDCSGGAPVRQLCIVCSAPCATRGTPLGWAYASAASPTSRKA